MKHKLRNTAVLSALAISGLHLFNKYIIASSTIKDLLSDHSGNYYSWRFGKVYYRKSGEGKPLLLIHDLSVDSSSYEWSKLEQKLAKEYTVYTLDLPGCGRSDKPNLTYTNFFYVQLINEFTTKVIKSRTNVVATGLSGSFVVMACNSNPDLYDKLILINPENLQALNQIPGKYSKITKLLLDCPIIGTALYHLVTNKNVIDHVFLEKYFYNHSAVKKHHLAAYHEAAHKVESGGKYLFSSLRGHYLNLNIAHALKKIDNSIFIIGGKHEPYIQSTIDSYTALNPAIETAIIDKTKHLPQLEAPEKVYHLIRIYL